MDFPTNEQVLMFFQDQNINISEFNKAIKRQFPVFDQVNAQPLSIFTKYSRLKKKYQQLNKNGNTTAITKLLDTKFAIENKTNLDRSLEISTEAEKKLKKELYEMKVENRSLKRKCEVIEKENTSIEIELEAMEEKYVEVVREYECLGQDYLKSVENQEMDIKEKERLRKEMNVQEDRIKDLESKYSALRLKSRAVCTRNINKRLKRREQKIEKLESEIKTVKDNLRIENEQKAETVNELEKLKERQMKLTKKYNTLKKKESRHSTKDTKNEIDHDIEDLEQKINLLQQENRELEQLVDILREEEVVTFQDGRYCDEVREVIMELLSMNVSMNKVNEVIRIVLKKLAGKDIGRLPSNAVKSRLLVEARVLAQSQVAEAVLKDVDVAGGRGNCLHGDGTSKYHRHFQNFQLSLKDGQQLSLGLKEMAGGDAAATMKAFTEIIEDLAESLIATNEVNTDDKTREELVAKMIVSIKSTMSDQGPTNPCFNRQLKVLRENLLPTIEHNWENLETNSKESIKDMCNFFCKMHLLPNLATESDKTLKLFEQICIEKDQAVNSYYTTSESGTARLVREVAKAFHPRGSEEAGVAAYFQSYLHGKNSPLKLISYKGNRFNILFFDAAATYFHRQHIIDFLDSWPNPNNLLKSISENIRNPVYVACVRALGIVDKVITGPFWRLLESTNSILDMNPHLLQMKLSFERWSNNASTLLEGEALFENVEMHRDEVFESLFALSGDAEVDTITIQCLEVIMHAFLIILERQAGDQLPGGQYYNVSEATKAAAENVPPTNKISEKEFASLDLLMRTKPYSKVTSHEAIIMWTHNQTRVWLDEKNDEEKKLLLKGARESFNGAVAKYRERNQVLKQERMEKLMKKQQEKEKTIIRQQTLKVNSTNNLLETGHKIWCTEDEMAQNLENMSEKDKKSTLLAQIRFHKNVLKSKGPIKLFAQSTTENGKRKLYNIQDLEKNLKEIISLNPVSIEQDEAMNQVVPQEKREDKFQEVKNKLFSKIIDQRIKRQINNSKLQLEELKTHPDQLVDRKIKHKCSTDNGAVWFEGTVTSIQTRDSMKSEYMVRYDDDEEDVEWMFPLLTDLQRGDLILL